MNGASATITTTTDGATIYYTTDGSDPRYSVEVKTYTAAVALVSGDNLRVYAAMDGMYSSGVAKYDYET